ncbi:MAG: hypothetical protein OXP71_00225 [Candidatus Poribacteria bacterium]|nr:hypothetical protein [Candidatus Poribacteria bacterium]
MSAARCRAYGMGKDAVTTMGVKRIEDATTTGGKAEKAVTTRGIKGNKATDTVWRHTGWECYFERGKMPRLR